MLIFFPHLLQRKQPLNSRLICDCDAAADRRRNINGAANAHEKRVLFFAQLRDIVLVTMSKMIDRSLQIASDELLCGWEWRGRFYSYRNQPTKCKRCWLVHCAMHLLSYSQYMFSLLRFDAVLKAQSVLSNRRGGTQKSTALYCGTCSVWIMQKLWRAEGSARVAICDVERERGDRIKVDVFGPSGARSLDRRWRRMGRLHGNAETVRVYSLLQ